MHTFVLCNKCHHADLIHAPPKNINEPFNRGTCSVPGCACSSYVDAISKIDEDLL